MRLVKLQRLIRGLWLALLWAGLSFTGPSAAAGELSAAERAELEAQLEEARAQLDEAAQRLGELHGQLYEIETLGDHGKKPMLGVLLDEHGSAGGLDVVGVTPGGGAQAAGLLTGDRLISVNGLSLADRPSAMAALHDAMAGVVPGQTVPVEYQRDGSVALVNVTTQARGVYFMDIAGAPNVNIDVDKLEALEQMAETIGERFADMDFSAETGWVEALENLGELGPRMGTFVSRAMSLGGGLRLEDVDGDLAGYFGVEQGVLVMGVPAGAAQGTDAADDLSRLKAGDILLSVDGEQIEQASDGYRLLLDVDDEPLAVEVLRQGVRNLLTLVSADFGDRHQSISIHQLQGVGSGAPLDVDVRIVRPDPP